MRHERDELNNSSAMSPPSLVGASLPNEPANFYANLFGGSPMGLLTPQMIAANQFNTAALLSKLYPHPLLSWQMPPMGAAASPPISPTSPISVKSLKKLNNNNNIVSTTTNEEYTNNNNNYKLNIVDDLKHNETNNTYSSIVQSPTTGKRSRSNRKAINFQKKRNTELFQPYAKLEPSSPSINSETVSPGPISPPTSGSSPQSIGSVEHHQSPTSSSVPAKETTRDKTFTCQTCNRSFGYKHVLQNHERTHTGEKPYACPICSKRFTRDHHLKTHMRLHTGEKPYHCEHCDRHFVQVANLRRHLRVHTGEKPYTCSICTSKFSDSNQLKTHAIVHQDEKLYRCQTCDASFRRSHHLVNHKCTATVNSPLTPAMSPVMSMDTKSIASRSDVSQDDDLLDLSTQSAALIKNLTLNFNHYHQTHNGNSNQNNSNNNNNNHNPNNNKSTSNLLSPTIKQEPYEHHANDNYNDAQDMPLDLSIDSSNSDNGKNRSDSV